MPTYTIAGYFENGPGSTITAYKATQFGDSTPAYNTPFPGAPDAGPIFNGFTYGGPTSFLLNTIPTVEDYWVASEYLGNIYWQFFSAGMIGGQGSSPGSTLLNFGFLEVDLLDNDSNVYVRTYVSPSVLQGSVPAGYATQWAPSSEGMSPLNLIPAAGALAVEVSQNLAPDLWDGVDIYGTLTIWDQAGKNILVAIMNGGPFTSASDPTFLSLTLVQVIGSDLSIIDGYIVISANGGSYNMLLQPIAEWD